MLRVIENLEQVRTIKWRQAARILRKLGFEVISSRGTHQRWRHPDVPEAFLLVYKDEDLKAYQLHNMIAYLKRHERILDAAESQRTNLQPVASKPEAWRPGEDERLQS